MTQLLNLPIELVQLIIDHQESEREINALVRTCRYLYNTFNVSLYQYDVKRRNRSVLFWAAQRGIDGAAANSLKAGPYTEVTDMTGDTPLIIAATRGHLGVMKQLLTVVDHGLDLETKGQYDRTALALTACYGQTEAAKLLLERGADREAKDMDRKTPLLLAALNGHDDTVRLLLDHGAAVEAQDQHGRTALSWAAEYGSLSIVDLLLDQGAVVDTRTVNDSTPLILAVRTGREVVVKRLLKAGADPNASSANGWTALHHAAYNLQGQVVKHLLEAGSDPRATILHNVHRNKTPADLARMVMVSTSEKNTVYETLTTAAGDSLLGVVNTEG